MTFVLTGKEQFTHQQSAGDSQDLSFCIHGAGHPHLEVELAPGQGLACDAAHLIRHDCFIKGRTLAEENAGKRLYVNDDRTQPGRLVVAAPGAGPVGAFDLKQYGGRLLLPLEALLAVGPGVGMNVYVRYRSIRTRSAPQGLALVLFDGDGWVFSHARGCILERRLEPGRVECVRMQAIAAMTATVDLEIVEGNLQAAFALATGPGTVWLQSALQPELGPEIRHAYGAGFGEDRYDDNGPVEPLRAPAEILLFGDPGERN